MAQALRGLNFFVKFQKIIVVICCTMWYNEEAYGAEISNIRRAS